MKKQSFYIRGRKLVHLISFILFPFTIRFFSPYLSVAGAWSGAVTAAVITFGAMLVLSPFLGRLFCSWICPTGQFQDQLAQVVVKKAGGPGRWWRKYLVWAPWLGLLLGGLAVHLFSATGVEWAPWWQPGQGETSMDEGIGFLVVLAGNLFIELIVLSVFFILSLTLGARGGCHNICWMSPFLILGRKIGNALRIPAIRLKAESERCIHCGKCNAACPPGIPVQSLVERRHTEHAECILCGECVDVCPKDVLSIRIARV